MPRALLQPCGSSLPPYTHYHLCGHSSPCPVPAGPSCRQPLIVQMGKLRPSKNGAAHATQQVSSRVSTETQPRSWSLSPLPATSASPPVSHCRSGPGPADPAGEAQTAVLRVGFTQAPGSHVGTSNGTWLGGRTWLLIPALPWTLSERPCPSQGLSFSVCKIYEVNYSCGFPLVFGAEPQAATRVAALVAVEEAGHLCPRSPSSASTKRHERLPANHRPGGKCGLQPGARAQVWLRGPRQGSPSLSLLSCKMGVMRPTSSDCVR